MKARQPFLLLFNEESVAQLDDKGVRKAKTYCWPKSRMSRPAPTTPPIQHNDAKNRADKPEA